MATLASLIVKVGADTRDLRRGLDSSKKKLIGFQKTAISLRGTMIALAGAAGVGLAAKRIFDLGSAVEETASKFRTVFGPASESVQEFIDDFATMAGLSTEAAQEILATTGAIVQGMGFAQVASADFAESVVTLAGDLSSFNNIPVAETSRAIQAALTGERESLKRLGVVILETDVQKRALIDTGKESAAALNQEEKAAATLALITERAGVAMGDLVRTQDSAANVARRVGARWQNLKEIAATSLLPVMAQLLDAFDKQSESTSVLEQRIKSTGRFLEELVINIELGIISFKQMDAELNLFFAQAASGFRNIGRAIGLDLPDNVRIAELALNNLTIESAERLAELNARLSVLGAGLRDDVVAPATTAKTALDLFMESGRGAADQTRTMTLAIVGTVPGWDTMWANVQRTTQALRDYNEEAGRASQISKFLGKALTGASILGGLGPVSGFLSKGLSAIGLFDHGGSIGRGEAGIVGERGPELVQGPANVTSRADTASMMGGEMVFKFIFEQEGIPVRRISKKIKRNDSLGVSERLAIPAPSIG